MHARAELLACRLIVRAHYENKEPCSGHSQQPLGIFNTALSYEMRVLPRYGRFEIELIDQVTTCNLQNVS